MSIFDLIKASAVQPVTRYDELLRRYVFVYDDDKLTGERNDDDTGSIWFGFAYGLDAEDVTRSLPASYELLGELCDGDFRRVYIDEDEFVIVTYVEGDITIERLDDEEAFADKLEGVTAFYLPERYPNHPEAKRSPLNPLD